MPHGRAHSKDPDSLIGTAPQPAVGAFRPGWLPTLVVVLLLPGLLWLGVWQLQRAAEKQHLQSLYEQRQQAMPLSLSALMDTSELAYRRVRLDGYFDTAHSILLDNRTRAGRAGVEWLQPFFDRASDRWVLVNRGWQAWPDRRETPQLNTPQHEVSLYGWIYQPLGEPLLLSRTAEQQAWPRLAAFVEPEQIWQQLQRQGFAYQVRLDPGPWALQVDWPVVATAAAKHQGYALQWFAMAAALLALFIYLGFQNGRENNNEQAAATAD